MKAVVLLRMSKGPGDFSPPDPVECPEDCVFYTPERGGHDYCQYGNGCQYDPDNQPVKGEEKGT